MNQKRRVIDVKSAFRTLEKTDDSFILNSKQRKMFDRIIEHYLLSIKNQFLLQIKDDANTKKSLCINMISKHLHYYVAQYNQRNSVIQTVFIDVVVHKIENVILHSLFFLFVHESFNQFDAD